MVNKHFEFSNSAGLNKTIIVEKPRLGGSFFSTAFKLGKKYLPKLLKVGLPFLKKQVVPLLETSVEKALGAVSNLFGKSREKIENVLPEALKPPGKKLIDSAEEKVNNQILQKLKIADEAIKKYRDFGSYGYSEKKKKGDGISKKQALDFVGDIINQSRQKIENILPSALNIADEQIRQKMRLGQEAFDKYKGDGFVSDLFRKGNLQLQNVLQQQINPLKDRYINVARDEVNKQLQQKLGYVGSQFDKIRDFQIGKGLSSKKSRARQKIKKLLA